MPIHSMLLIHSKGRRIVWMGQEQTTAVKWHVNMNVAAGAQFWITGRLWEAKCDYYVIDLV